MGDSINSIPQTTFSLQKRSSIPSSLEENLQTKGLSSINISNITEEKKLIQSSVERQLVRLCQKYANTFWQCEQLARKKQDSFLKQIDKNYEKMAKDILSQAWTALTSGPLSAVSMGLAGLYDEDIHKLMHNIFEGIGKVFIPAVKESGNSYFRSKETIDQGSISKYQTQKEDEIRKKTLLEEARQSFHRLVLDIAAQERARMQAGG